MKHTPSNLGAFWGVLWRSVVLLPISALFLVLLCGAFVLVLVSPILALACAWNSDWWHAVAWAALWVPAFGLLRWWWRRERAGNNWSPF